MKHDVLGFQIAMDDTLFVRGGQCMPDLTNQTGCSRQLDALRCHDRAQVDADDVLHDEIRSPIAQLTYIYARTTPVSKTNGITQLSHLEHFLREDLNKHAARVMAVLRPLRVVIDNYPDDVVEEMDAINNPEDASMGSRKVPFSKVIYIEQEDFREDPPTQYFQLAPGREVRLRYAYLITLLG